MRKWTKQPPGRTKIDWGHPMAKYLQGYINPAEGMRWINGPAATANSTVSLETNHSTEVFANGPLGKGLKNDSTTTAFENEGFVVNNPSTLNAGVNGPGWTFVMAMQNLESINPLASRGFLWFDTSNMVRTSSAAGEFFWQLSASFRGTPTGSVTEGIDKTVIAGSMNNSPTTGRLFMGQDGRTIQNEAHLLNLSTDWTQLQILSTGGEGLNPQSCNLAGFWAFNGSVGNGDFTTEQLLSMTRNPWQIFKPPKNFALADPLPQTRVLNVPQVWTEQPPAGTGIDWSNPLTKDLLFCVPSNKSSGYPIEVVSGREMADGSLPEQTVGIAGNALTTDSTTTNPTKLIDVPRRAATGSETTLFALLEYEYDASAQGGAISWYNSGDGKGLSLYIENASATSLYFRLYFLWYGDYVRVLIPIQPRKPYTFVATQNGAGEVNLYLDGVLWHTATRADRVNHTDAAHDLQLLGSNLTGTMCIKKQYLAGIADRVWSPGEVADFAENPWQIFQPQDLQVPIEYEELTFDETKEERLYIIPQGATRQPR